MAFSNAVDAVQEGVQYLSSLGAWVGVDGGTAGHILTSNGTGVAPSFQAGSAIDLHTARYIVSAGGIADGANYTTIGSAITAAAAAGAPQTVFVQSGTYTENITLVAGINISGYGRSAILVGTISASYNGSCTIEGMSIETNSAVYLNITGSNTSFLTFQDCSLASTNNNGITMNAANYSLYFNTCTLFSDPTFNMFSLSAGQIITENTFYSASDATPNSVSGGFLTIYNGAVSTVINTSGTGSATLSHTNWGSSSTLSTLSGTSQLLVYNSVITSTSFSIVSIGSGCTFTTTNSTYYSSNINIFTGAGTIIYGGIVFGGSSGINVTTQTPIPWLLEEGGTYPYGTAGQVLTSNGTGVATPPSWQAAGGGGSVTITGDSGSISGSSLTIFANQTTLNSGGTVKFVNSGTTSTFDVTDTSFNTIIGLASGKSSITGSSNTGLGWNVLAAITSSAQSNTAIGVNALQQLTTGTSNTAIGQSALAAGITADSNIAIGFAAMNHCNGGTNNIAIGINGGANYAGTEANNIVIGNFGNSSENSVIRIGTQGTGTGQQNSCFIAGITGATFSSGTPTPALVYVDTTNGQLLAYGPPVASSVATSGFGSIAVGTALQNTLGYDILVNVSVALTAAVGATIVMGVGSTSTPTTNAMTGTIGAALTASFSAIVPANYYILVNTTGTVTVGSITTQACAL